MDYKEYYSLDDAFENMYLKDLDTHLEFYISSLHRTSDNPKSLIIVRPRYLQCAGVQDLKEFLLKHARGELLIACWHYTQYRDWLEKDITTEFVTKEMRKHKDYPLFKKLCFDNAHYEANKLCKRIHSIFSQDKTYIEMRKMLVEAIKNKENRLNISLEILLRGFY